MARQHTRLFHSRKQCVERYVWEGCNSWGVAPWPGDIGYPLRPWLLTQVLNPTTRPEERYNASHIRTRNTVERSFGVLISRFRCLDTIEGYLLYSPTKACRVMVAVAVLRNMCINNGVPIPADCVDAHDRGRIGRPQYIGPINDGVTVRNRLINGRFA